MNNSILIDDILDIIYDKKKAMCVHEINEQIKKLGRECGKADDIWSYYMDSSNGISFWEREHEVYYITTNKDYKIRSLYLDYQTQRFLNRQWTYICKKCGEYLVLINPKPKDDDIDLIDSNFYECRCGRYINHV